MLVWEGRHTIQRLPSESDMAKANQLNLEENQVPISFSWYSKIHRQSVWPGAANNVADIVKFDTVSPPQILAGVSASLNYTVLTIHRPSLGPAPCRQIPTAMATLDPIARMASQAPRANPRIGTSRTSSITPTPCSTFPHRGSPSSHKALGQMIATALVPAILSTLTPEMT